MITRLPLPLTLAGLLFLYIGERTLAGAAHWAVSGLGLALILGSLGASIVRWQQADANRKTASGRLALEYGLVVVGLLVYAVQLDVLELVPDGDLKSSLQVLWPAIVILGLAPAITMEMALASMASVAVASFRIMVFSFAPSRS